MTRSRRATRIVVGVLMLLVLALLLSFVFQTQVYAFFGLAGLASVVLVYNEMRKSGESG